MQARDAIIDIEANMVAQQEHADIPAISRRVLKQSSRWRKTLLIASFRNER